MKALVIADDSQLSNLVATHLGEHGFLVTQGRADQEPLPQILQTEPHLVVMDIDMPRLHGMDALVQIRQHPTTANIPVLMLTAQTDAYAGWQAGLDWYLIKPFEPADLSASIEQILDSDEEHPVLAAAQSGEETLETDTLGIGLGKTALAVDDDEDIARLVATYLESLGFITTVAFDGTEALERIRQKQPDLVVLDVEMPTMDGLEVLRNLRKDISTARLPVILLTARDQISDLFEGWFAGTDFYITKPFEKQTLLEQVQNIFTRE